MNYQNLNNTLHTNTTQLVGYISSVGLPVPQFHRREQERLPDSEGQVASSVRSFSHALDAAGGGAFRSGVDYSKVRSVELYTGLRRSLLLLLFVYWLVS